MKNLILIIFAMVFLTSCTTTTKILTEREPRFNGINGLFEKNTKNKNGKTLKIFMIHGIGDTDSYYASKFVKRLEENGFNLKSLKKPESKEVYTSTITIAPKTNNCPNICEFTAIASIKTYYFSKGDKNLNLYSFYWNDMNKGLQEYMLKDVYKVSEHDLENEMLKLNKFVRETLDIKISDVVAYANPQFKEEIRTATKNGICFMHDDTQTATTISLGTFNTGNINKLCNKESKSPKNNNYAFVSISLGSQILFDTLYLAYDSTTTGTIETFETKAQTVSKNTDEFYMLANQIPLTDAMNLNLEVSKKEDKNKKKNETINMDSFSYKINKLTKNNGELKIISFVAPNDFLSYPLTSTNKNITNIQIGNSNKFLLFTYPLDGGHGIEYLDNPKLVNYIINGENKEK